MSWTSKANHTQYEPPVPENTLRNADGTPYSANSAVIPMRRFIIVRSVDITGISGTGIILYGVEWLPGGPCDVYWLGTKTTGQYPSIDVVKSTHCYNNNARVEYID